jgi:hypothetical protein
MNWGNKLLVAFIVFIGGMGYLVYRSMNTEFQLVEKDYYKKEIAYQQVIDRSKEANKLSAPVEVLQPIKDIEIRLPPEMKGKEITGDVWFYCSYEQANDKHLKLQTDSNGVQAIAGSILNNGTYTVKITWQQGDKKYYSESQLKVQ